MPQVSYKLSPNEEAAVLRSQREERRKARLVQVREQEREAARKTREEEKQKREKERKLLHDHLQSHLLASHAAELAAVEDRYSSAARHFGLGHRQAQQVEKEENRLHELRLLLTSKQRERAEDRHIAALREEQSYQHQKKGEKKRQIERLMLTREQEGRRARENATRATHQPPIIMDLVAGKGRRVRLREVEGYSSSYYHIPSCTVERTATEEREGPDAQQIAVLMSEEKQALDKQCSAVKEEQKELARLRHIHALNKVKIQKEKQELLQQLKTLEREDRTLRQKALATMPNNIYQPVERKKEVVKEQQRDMEQAFERLFVETHGVSTYPTLHRAANPTPDPITPSPQPSHPSSTPACTASSQETTPTNCTNSDASLLEHSTLSAGGDNPDQKVRKSVKVSIPTVKLTESDCSYTSSIEVTPAVTPNSGSFSASIDSSTSMAANKEETTCSLPDLAQSDGITQGIIAKGGAEELKIVSSRQLEKASHHVTTSNSDLISSTPQQQEQQQGLHELSVSELTPSEIQYPTEEQSLPQTTTALPLKRSGMTRLVSMVHAQQQAWSQRVAARHTLTEPTTIPQQQLQPNADWADKAMDSTSTDSSPVSESSHHYPPSPKFSTTGQPPSLNICNLSSRDGSTITLEGSKKAHLNEVTRNRNVGREAWLKLSNPTKPPRQNADLHTATVTNVPSHPLTHTMRQPFSQPIPPPTMSLSGPAIHDRAEPLGITAYESTFNTSSMLGEHNLQQHNQESTLLYQPTNALHTSHPSNEPEQHITKADVSMNERGSESGKEKEGNIRGKGLMLTDKGDKYDNTADRSCDLSSHAALGLTGRSFLPPPLVTKTQPADTVYSSEHSSWSEDSASTSLFPDTPTNIPSSSVVAQPLSIYPSLPLKIPVPSDHSTHTPSQPHTLTPSLPSTITPSHPHQFSTSHLSTSILTPSTVSGFTLTPVSSLADPSPIVHSVEHTPFCKLAKIESVPSDTSSQGYIMPCCGGYESGQRGNAPASLARPNLSMATEDTDRGHQDTTPCPDMSTETAQSLDTTPTHTTLHLPGDMSESDPSISPTVSDASDLPPPTSSSKPANIYVSPNFPPEQVFQSDTLIPSPSPATSTAGDNSLQKAFLKRKMNFVKQSQRRLEQLKSNASERRIQSSLKSDSTAVHQHQKANKPFNKTKNQEPKSPSKQQSSLFPSFPSTSGSHLLPEAGKENRKRAVTFSSPVLCSSRSSVLFSPPLEHKAPAMLLTQKKDKISTKEMQQRNQRFYNRLPEVRRRKLEEQRLTTYAANRQKAKVYQEKVRAKIQRKPLQVHTMTRKPPFK